MTYKWKPSKAAAREFAAKMQEIADFCRENGISQSARGDSYYFEIAGQSYRVSNHTPKPANSSGNSTTPTDAAPIPFIFSRGNPGS